MSQQAVASGSISWHGKPASGWILLCVCCWRRCGRRRRAYCASTPCRHARAPSFAAAAASRALPPRPQVRHLACIPQAIAHANCSCQLQSSIGLAFTCRGNAQDNSNTALTRSTRDFVRLTFDLNPAGNGRFSSAASSSTGFHWSAGGQPFGSGPPRPPPSRLHSRGRPGGPGRRGFGFDSGFCPGGPDGLGPHGGPGLPPPLLPESGSDPQGPSQFGRSLATPVGAQRPATSPAAGGALPGRSPAVTPGAAGLAAQPAPPSDPFLEPQRSWSTPHATPSGLSTPGGPPAVAAGWGAAAGFQVRKTSYCCTPSCGAVAHSRTDGAATMRSSVWVLPLGVFLSGSHSSSGCSITPSESLHSPRGRPAIWALGVCHPRQRCLCCRHHPAWPAS